MANLSTYPVYTYYNIFNCENPYIFFKNYPLVFIAKYTKKFNSSFFLKKTLAILL